MGHRDFTTRPDSDSATKEPMKKETSVITTKTFLKTEGNNFAFNLKSRLFSQPSQWQCVHSVVVCNALFTVRCESRVHFHPSRLQDIARAKRISKILAIYSDEVPLINLPKSSLDGFMIHCQVGEKKGKQANTPSSYKPREETASWWLLVRSQFLRLAVVAHMKRLESASRRQERSFKSVKYGGKLSSASFCCTFHHMTCELSRNLAHFTVGGREGRDVVWLWFGDSGFLQTV